MPCVYADTPVAQLSQAAAESAVLCLINEQRAVVGSPPLSLNPKLRAEALQHAKDSARLKWWPPGGGPVVHQNPERGSEQVRIKAAGYCSVNANPPRNENCRNDIYKGNYVNKITPRHAVAEWMKSHPHRMTLLNPEYNETGVAVIPGVPEANPILKDQNGNPLFDADGNPVPPDGGFIFVQTFGHCRQLELVKLGQAWAWGNNKWGELGDGSTNARHTPVPVVKSPRGPAFDEVAAISAGSSHSLAVKTDGTVWAWGDNNDGELGDGTTTDRLTPHQVPGLSGVVDVAAGWNHSLALTADSLVWAWGANDEVQLGVGDTLGRPTPVLVLGYHDTIAPVIAIAAGSYHNLVLDQQGYMYAWGPNTSGQVGDPDYFSIWPYSYKAPRPVQVDVPDVVAIAAGGCHSLALTSYGWVAAWGGNAYGELGTGDTTLRSEPVPVPGLKDVVAIAAGGGHSLALKNDGSVWAWGDNKWGQLGDGTTVDQLKPKRVPGLVTVTAIAAGAFHSLALTNGGDVWAWGNNAFGQLGDGTTVDQLKPKQMLGLRKVAAIAGGHTHTLGIAPPQI
ncbi:CAP domain-containing protein [Streptomyces sp. P1-3]|uniref:RCC1 domain-containing protein n=1 Tax=Streptomyces sp. P1-3 TaxID=3421658 RepID=UPI003D35E397